MSCVRQPKFIAGLARSLLYSISFKSPQGGAEANEAMACVPRVSRRRDGRAVFPDRTADKESHRTFSDSLGLPHAIIKSPLTIQTAFFPHHPRPPAGGLFFYPANFFILGFRFSVLRSSPIRHDRMRNGECRNWFDQIARLNRARLGRAIVRGLRTHKRSPCAG
jgi:hypothetical protein